MLGCFAGFSCVGIGSFGLCCDVLGWVWSSLIGLLGKLCQVKLG